MLLGDLIATHQPESHPREQETWAQRASYLWATEPRGMADLLAMMSRGDWPFGPAILDDGYVQDSHHRIVIALQLGWHDREIPVMTADHQP